MSNNPLQKRIAGVWSNAARLFFALWYLLGSLIHIWYGLTNNHIYQIFGQSSIFAISRCIRRLCRDPGHGARVLRDTAGECCAEDETGGGAPEADPAGPLRDLRAGHFEVSW